jgi:predicted PurR-regulated permease PerM
MKNKEKLLVDISAISVAKATLAVLVVLVSAYLLFRISDVIMIFFISFFITAALDPLIDFLESKKVPRFLSLFLVYILSFILISLFFAMLLPMLADQLSAIIGVIGQFINDLSNKNLDSYPFAHYLQALDTRTIVMKLQESIGLIYQQVLSLGGNIWDVLMAVSNGLMNLLIVLVLVFFMTVDEKAIESFYLSIFPKKHASYVSNRMQMVKEKIGHWIRGQFMVSLSSGIITLIGLAVVGVKYSLTLAILVAILMVVPVFGRLFAWIISIPIVLSQSVGLAIYLTIFYLAVSQVENNYLVPKLMSKAVGLSPILIIFVLMVGLNYLGILGLVISIPVATIFAIFIKDIGERINLTNKKS